MSPIILVLAVHASDPIVPVVTAVDGQREAAGDMGLDAVSIVGDPAGPPLSGPELALATKSVASSLRCPTCQGMSVYDSPAEGARAMRAEVERMLERGFSGEQVLDYFRAGYGDFILLEPRKEGANWWLWVGPAGLGLVGAGAVVARVSRGHRAVNLEKQGSPPQGEAGTSAAASARGMAAGADEARSLQRALRQRVEREVSE